MSVGIRPFTVSVRKEDEVIVREALEHIQKNRIKRSGIICDLLRLWAESGYNIDAMRSAENEPVI